MKYIIPLIIFSVFSLPLFAQTNILAPDSALSYFKSAYPQEKVFAQTDQSQYLAGETIWIKAWCTFDGAPTYLSRILYIDLVNDGGKVIQKKMYRLDSLSSTAANLDLAPEMPSGNYRINAYSLWMLNFPEFIFHKNIFVFGPDFQPKAGSAKPQTIRLDFFPEGGDMMEGIINRVAFKSVDANGLPADCSGSVTDNSGKKIAAFSTEHDGLGSFEITPEKGATYTANIAMASGVRTFNLPAAKPEGINLRVENANPNKLFILLNRADKGKEKYAKVKVAVQLHYQLLFNGELNMDAGETTVPVNKKNLPPGIMQITVFDRNGDPVAERLAFVENYDLASPQLQVNNRVTGPRQKNQVSFSIPDSRASSVSCLVTDATAADNLNGEENIASSLLVTSDLKGYINNPGYYFKDKNAQTLHHLDLLLMTQGWRRFSWQDITGGRFAKIAYPVESGIAFRGIVTKSDRKEIVKDGKVSFLIKGDDSTSILGDATITDKGEFILNDVAYKKRATVYYMGTDNKKSNFMVDVKLFPGYIDSLKSSLRTPLINLDTAGSSNALFSYLNTRLKDSATGIGKYKSLQNIVIKSRKISREDSLNREYTQGPFVMGKSIDPDAYKSYRSIWQIIQVAVPGVTVTGNPFDPTVSFNRFEGLPQQDNTQSIGGESSDGSISAGSITLELNGIAYYLNEINVAKEVINTITPEDVALIKVMKNEAAALGASRGAIAIYTKKGAVAGKLPYDKTYASEKREGYAIVREYYNPDYAADSYLYKNGPDQRQTIYWNGNIRKGKDNQYHLYFFNNDISTRLKIIIQGMDGKGQLIYKEQILK